MREKERDDTRLIIPTDRLTFLPSAVVVQVDLGGMERLGREIRRKIRNEKRNFFFWCSSSKVEK